MSFESLAHAGSLERAPTPVCPFSTTGSGFGPGTVLRDSYRILQPIGAGGMGRVFSAEHLRLPGLLAVKALHPGNADNENAIARFRIEAEIMASLRHPNIVQVIDYDVAPDGTPYMVMELIAGRNLGERLRAGESLAPVRAGRIINEIARALDLAHRCGIVHRDLKPENIMLASESRRDDIIKVVDFGISKAERTSQLATEAMILGTPQFMAPEQAEGRNQEVDHRTDQFALAAIAYTLLAGVEPFAGGGPAAILYRVVREPAPPLAAQVSWPCVEVGEVIARAMAKDMNARYGSILEFSGSLVQALAKDLKTGSAHRHGRAVAPLPLVRRKPLALAG